MQSTWLLSRRIIFIVLFISGLAARSQSKKDSLWAVWKNTQNADSSRLIAIGHLCSNYYWYSDPDSAIILADLEYNLAHKKNLKNFMGVSLLKKSGGYSYKGDHHNSLYYSQQGLKIFREIKHAAGVANSLNNIGQDHVYLGNYAEAVHCFYESLGYFTKMGDKKAQAQAYSNIGDAYRISGNLDSAIRLNKYALSLCEEIGSKAYIAFIAADLSALYMDLKQTDEASGYCKKAAALCVELGNKFGEAQSLHNMGKIFFMTSDYGQATVCLEKSLALCKSIKDARGTAACYLVLSELNNKRGKTMKAISYARQGLAAINYRHVPELTFELASLLSALEEKNGNYRQAFEMHKLAMRERDSTNRISVKNAIYQEDLKHDFERKELLAKTGLEKKLNSINAEAERKVFRNNIVLTIAILVLIIFLLSGLFAYNYFRQKNTIATQKNNILKQQLLVSQMSPHFIFNSLNAVQNFIFKQDSHNAGIYLKQFSELIRMILNYSTKELILLEEEFNFLKTYLELQKLRFHSKLNYELTIDPNLDMETVLLPPMLAQPFVENAIEHGIFYKNGEGFLSIKISLEKNTLIYEIEDNGIGLEQSLKIKKEIKARHKSLAINITKERIEAMNKQNPNDFGIEIKDKGLLQKESSGVYVKFATPYLTL